MNTALQKDTKKEKEYQTAEIGRMIQKMHWTGTYIDPSEYVTFRLGYDHYGMKKEDVHDLVSLPHGEDKNSGPEPWIRSINHQGRLIPVVQLTPESQGTPAVLGSDNTVIIVRIKNDLMGMIVSRVSDVVGIY